MFIEVTGNLVRDNEMKEGRFLINSDYIAMLGANGTKANFHLSNGLTIYSDANLADIVKKIEQAKLFGD